MIRSRLMAAQQTEGHGFRPRGREVSRLEGLSDAVFGFAITLLVVSLEVPRTATQLFEVMRGFGSFAASFALLFLVWWNQYRFFRRYGLNDGVTTVLNAVLLFVIVFFVYPLKFVFTIVIGMFAGYAPWRAVSAGGDPVLTHDQWPMLMVVFSGGYVAVFLIFALLHLHAYRMREPLELDPLEQFDTLTTLRESMLNVGIGILSILLAVFGGGMGPFLGGMVYWVVGPAMWANGHIAGRARRRLQASLTAG
ncbi:MAG TPA: TMEM175 family protein [Longimicrobium sp.]|nr:TMEM175 family protein [Longimicrobium sp.]